jgi:hypothetical protein
MAHSGQHRNFPEAKRSDTTIFREKPQQIRMSSPKTANPRANQGDSRGILVIPIQLSLKQIENESPGIHRGFTFWRQKRP